MELDVQDIGSSLRAERERLGLSLKQAEGETRIRTRYLAALEDDRFDELPADAYVRGFLRCYAVYLGLDGSRYLAAYRARVGPAEPAIAPVPLGEPRRGRAAAVTATVAVAGLGALALGAWKLEDRGSGPADAPRTVVPARLPETVPAPAPAAAPAAAQRRQPEVLVLRTAGGDCWLDIRIGGPAGKRAWTGTLREGQTLRLGLGKALFIRAGAPHNLRATIRGAAQPIGPAAFDLVATRQGLRPAA